MEDLEIDDRLFIDGESTVNNNIAIAVYDEFTYINKQNAIDIIKHLQNVLYIDDGDLK